MKLLFIEPFFGGSHQQFAEGLKRHSSHQIDLVALPAVNWNWRFRGSALYFSKHIKTIEKYDGIITTNLMRLSDFKAYVRKQLPPVMVYFHENQITYPLAPKEKRNPHLCMGDISTALTADRILFNSDFHKTSFFGAVSEVIDNSPDFPSEWVLGDIQKKSGVIYPGCSFRMTTKEDVIKENEPPLIIWNHRWSYDKNAGDFFHALRILKKNNIDFKLAVLGENSEQIPDEFIRAEVEFKDNLICFGYAKSREDYIHWLQKGDVVISTAIQENFGIAVIEAMYYGCIPLLPDRLSYPEILPKAFHSDSLYKSQRDLIEKLSGVIQNCQLHKKKIQGLQNFLEKYTWEQNISTYDDAIEKMILQ